MFSHQFPGNKCGGRLRSHYMKRRLPRFCIFILGAALAASIVFMATFPEAQATDGESAAAIWSRGVLHVTLPYHGLHAGAGQLTIEVLDPEDGILGRSERRVEAADGKRSWQADLKLAKPLALDELVRHPLPYRFAYSDPQRA